MSVTRLPSPRRAWAADHPVLDVLRRRRAEDSRPGSRSDGYRVALAVEGGGLRGIVSAAMLTALEDLGYTQTFDVVYSCSSGAVNSAYFLVGDTWYPLSIYFDDLASKRFLDFRRGLRGRPLIDLDFALDEIVHFTKPMDYASVRSSPIPLCIMVTNVDDLDTVLARDFTSDDDLRAALRASMWLPIAVPGTTSFRGFRAVDGGVLTAHPFLVAQRTEDAPPTHVLSLSTRPMGSMRPGVSWLNRYVGTRLNRIRPGLGTGHLRSVQEYKQARVALERQRAEPVPGPYILDLAPLPAQREVVRHEMNPWRLFQGARDGYEVAYFALEGRYRRAMPRLVIPDHGRHDFRFPVDLDDGEQR
ncbi:patatin-like phospholipase family protein [Actinoplanes sp. NPDC048796]|uniref:patatin-like phospholipase family protein n=1 Tax=unclassified Actinoplanes TaxID=2626549 RepID=UPI003409077C